MRRARITPDEICELTINFYKRNYIEGLFLSSAVFDTPNKTMELLVETVIKLRKQYNFNGYIHLKSIPGASRELVDEAGRYADRLSVNIEIPNETSLRALAPEKDFQSVLAPMRYIQQGFLRGREESARFRHAPRFAPAGQSTQMIVGATPDTDRDILSLSAALYRRPSMKRVYYSGFIPVNAYDTRLPALAAPPLRRENRLYQADWLLRFYHFGVDEIVDDAHPDLDLAVDPKLSWALRHPEAFKLIVAARRHGRLGAEQLRRIGIVMKKARYFIDCRELPTRTVNEIGPERLRSLLARRESGLPDDGQLSLPFDENP